MSGNQKPTAGGGGPQTQRFAGMYPFQTSYAHQLSQHTGTDGFHVPTPPYVQQQQPNQPGNQTQTLRGIQPNGPPNQASTPPTNDLKVQSVQQQQSMNPMQYVGPQQQPRAQGYFGRTTGPPSQATRMPSQHRGQQQLYPTQPQFMMQMPTHMYVNQMPYFGSGQRPQSFVQQQMPVFGGQHIATSFTFSPNPNQTPAVPYPAYYPVQRTGHPPQTSAIQQNPTQPIHNMPLAQPPALPTPFQKQPNKRRAKAIPIIDPDTGVDKLDEVYEQQNSSHPPSGESSARQTPQPAIHNPSKEVQAAFAKQVAQAIGSDENSVEDMEGLPPPVDHIEPQPVYHQPPTNRLEHLVQSSNLKVQAKEFVLSPSNTAKETTPIVSANCDAAEVTLPNRQAKDRESPAKGRKPREQQQQQQQQQQLPQIVREHKDSVNKDAISNVSDKESSIKIDNSKQKESIAVNVTPTTVAPPLPVAVSNKDNKEVPPHRDDKKNHKKDVKTDSKVPSSDNESANNSIPQPPQPLAENNSNAKSKNASQRSKDGQKAPAAAAAVVAAAPQKPVALAPVPQPQPAKANNKSSKKTELNQKGANKEGTDMDAFSVTAKSSLDAINANVVETVNANVAPPTSDVINANSVPNNTATIVAPPPVNVNETNKKNNVNETTTTTATIATTTTTTTIRNEPKTLPKSRIDITDIVKEKPKPIKMLPVVVSETQDETDRAPLIADTLVLAKNEANAKTNENSGATFIENKSDLPYREGQWAPNNVDGKKVYDREFLLALRNNPASRKRPDNIPDVIIADERGRLSDGRYSMGGRATDFTNPPFTNYGGKSSSQRGPPPKRNSQSGKVGGGGAKGSKSQVIKVSISVREDVKLHEAENAWKPARLNKKEDMSEEDLKTQELYKKVRGVLNKLTPQKFETLVGQVRELQIDTAERLYGVINLVFEKAVDEPNFSVAYAYMCRELALMQVPVGPPAALPALPAPPPAALPAAPPALPAANSASGTNSTNSVQTVVGEVANFRKYLITRCQKEFEDNTNDETAKEQKLKEIAKIQDAEKRREQELELEENCRKLRVRSVGNIRFIGELFKQQMLTVNIMTRCLQNLLQNRDEESLECLCKLLTTVGKELESKNIDLSQIFATMKDIVDKKSGNVSSRVRFMLQDVIDLRKGKWVPRRQDLNPKTIDEIQKEAETEHLNIQVMNSVPMTPRKDERGGGGPNSDRRRRNVTDDGWQTASRNNRTQFTVHSDKLKNKPPLTDEPLGNRQMFGNWSKGSNIKTDQPAPPNLGNMYAALENIDSDKRPSGSRVNSKDPYSSKGPSLERSTYRQPYDGSRHSSRGSSRSGSQHRQVDNNPVVPQQKTAPAVTVPVVPRPVQPPAPVFTLTEDQLERHVRNNLDEYLNDSCTVEEYAQDTQTSVPPSYFARMVADGYLHVLERSMTARTRTGMLFAKLINMGTLPVENYCAGLEEVLSQADDLTIDIPKIWDYLAEILVHLICEEALKLDRLLKSSELIISQGHGSNLLSSLFKLVISEKGPNFLRSCWQASGVTLDSFMPQSQVDKFVEDNKFEFLLGGDTATGQTQLTYEQISKKLLEFFESKTKFDDIVNWITANVGERVKENKFIRALATAIFENSIVRHKLVPETLTAHYLLLLKYVDNNSNYELQCLYALQALIHKLEHPKGLLLSICDRLYEDTTFSQESFISWEQSVDPAEQEGKGVALKQLTSFFTQLKENEEEDYASSSGSEEA